MVGEYRKFLGAVFLFFAKTGLWRTVLVLFCRSGSSGLNSFFIFGGNDITRPYDTAQQRCQNSGCY